MDLKTKFYHFIYWFILAGVSINLFLVFITDNGYIKITYLITAITNALFAWSFRYFNQLKF